MVTVWLICCPMLVVHYNEVVCVRSPYVEAQINKRARKYSRADGRWTGRILYFGR